MKRDSQLSKPGDLSLAGVRPGAARCPTPGARPGRLRVASLLCAAGSGLALLAFWLALPVPSDAAETIASWGHGAGKVNGPDGTAVDQETGDLYVAEENNFRVSKFDSEGSFLLAWGYGVADGVTEELQVCGPAAEPPTKRCFAPNFFATKRNDGEGLSAESVAVEQSTRDVYVGERYDVAKFTPSGQLIYRVGRNVNRTKKAEAGATQAEKDFCVAASGDICGRGESGTGPGEFSSDGTYSPVLPFAFDSKGKLWVGDEGRLERFDPDGSFLEEVPLPVGARYSALAIDPTSDDFYVLGPRGNNEAQFIGIFQTGSSGTFKLTFEGETTASIDGNGSASEKGAEATQAALEALPAIGAGNVSVEAFGPEDYRVEFVHDLGGRDVPQLTASGGSPPLSSVSTNPQGSPGSVEKFDPTGVLIEMLDDELGDLPEALAADSAGNLYVGDKVSPYHLLKYDSSGELVSRFAAGQVLGEPAGNALALDEGSAERHPALYTASSREAGSGSPPTPAQEAQVVVQRFSLPESGPLIEGQRAEAVLPTGATLRATLNPEGHETTYRFEYDTSPYEGEAEHGTSVPVPDAALPGSGFEAEEVSAAIEGLTPDATYHFRLVATNHCNDAEPAEECTVYGEDTTFTTRTAVGIEAQWASAVAAHDATLNARLDPLGATATWWLEYDTVPYGPGEAPHGTQVVGGPLPAGFEEIPVAVALHGLQASTAYHYRFAATDVRDSNTYITYGSGRTFTTQTAGLGFALADGRAWEMVSPPDKHGGRIAAPDKGQGGQLQAAADGEALAYLSYGSLEARPEGNRLIEQSSELARRGSSGAWSTVDITAPHTTVIPYAPGAGLEYKLFSTNLERALLQPRDATPLSPEATERTPYVRGNASPPAYAPLVTASEVPPGTEFGKLEPEASAAKSAAGGNVDVRGASPDLRHVVLGSSVPLAAGAAVGSLYEWSAGGLEPVSVKPGEANAVQAQLGSGAGSTVGAVSEDGSRVFFTAGGLYVRDTARGETLRLDEVAPGGFGIGKADPLFQGASANGRVVFFTDSAQLTEDSNEEGADLYRCELVVEGGALRCILADLSAQSAGFGEPHSGESAEVLGLSPGIAADGSAAYFVASGVLDPTPNSQGESASPGQPNLYAWRQGEGVRFVATLSAQDEHDWGKPASGTDPQVAFRLTAALSSSGRYLAFMSQLPLTGYDNRDAASGERAQEVFRYDAATEVLACASCSPSGVRPRALRPGSDVGTLSGELPEEFDPNGLWSGKAVAALLPEVPVIESNSGFSLYRPRAVHDDGRVFFNVADSLVAADSNGTGDVYEYEPMGTGSCGPSSADPGTAVVPGACVSLISSGRADGAAAFLDASEGGSDVFFYSPGRLSVTDVDSEMDVYDAREGGEPATLSPLAECQGEACQPPASPPAAQTPASAAFRGSGNVREASWGRGHCAKGKRKVRRKGRARCVERAHKHRKRHRGHHRTHPNRRAR